MSDKFGWCFGPQGAHNDHDACPMTVPLGAGGQMRCGCSCHESED